MLPLTFLHSLFHLWLFHAQQISWLSFSPLGLVQPEIYLGSLNLLLCPPHPQCLFHVSFIHLSIWWMQQIHVVDFVHSCQATLHHIPADGNFHSSHHENLKCHTSSFRNEHTPHYNIKPPTSSHLISV